MKNPSEFTWILITSLLILLVPFAPGNSFPAAVAATEFYVDALQGDDSLGDGSQAKPWRTITHAMPNLSAGDTLHVLEGVYDTTLGETFPITVKPEITIVGAGLDKTILAGVPDQAVLYFDAVSHSYSSSTTVSDLTAQNGSAGIAIRAVAPYNASPTLIRLRLRWNTRGASLETGDVYKDGSILSPLLSDLEVTENTEAGIYLYAYGYFSPSFVSPTIEDCFIDQNGGPGIHIEASAVSSNGTASVPIIRRTWILSNGGDGLYNVGTYEGWVKPQIEESRIVDNGGYGFFYEMGLNGGNIDASITNSLIRLNLGGGVHIGRRSYYNYANGLLRITNSNIVDNDHYGIYWDFNPEELVAPLVKNSIIWNPGADDLYSTTGSWTTDYISYSDILDGDLKGQAGNLSVEPRYIDEYHLSACSPLMNGGTNEGAPTVDIDGEPRPQGASTDIGVDEYEARCSLLLDKHASTDHLFIGDSLAYTLTATSILTDTAVSLDLTDELPAGSAYVPDSLRASKGTALYTSGTISWSGSLAPQEAMTVTFLARATQAGISLVNQADIDAGENGLYASPLVTTLVSPRRVYLPRMLSIVCTSDFFDNFSDPSSGWATSDNDYVLAGYYNGEFRIRSRKSGYIYLFGAPTCPRQNYMVEVDARWEDEPGGSYGLLFGLQGNFENYYLFEVNTDYQLYILTRTDASGTTVIAPVAESSAIHKGEASNHLKVTRQGAWIYLEVNGVQLGSWQDAAITGLSGAGIAASPYENQSSSDARFDNFSLEELPSSGTSLITPLTAPSTSGAAPAASYPWLISSPPAYHIKPPEIGFTTAH